MSELIAELTDRDDQKAYARTREIAAASELSPAYYPHIGEFASLLNSKSSYIRTRAFILCCSQARWDTEGKLRERLPALLTLLHDPKPTVVRQCLNAVKEIIVFRPELAEEIRRGLESIDLSRYKDTVRPLIRKDMAAVRELLDETETKE